MTRIIHFAIVGNELTANAQVASGGRAMIALAATAGAIAAFFVMSAAARVVATLLAMVAALLGSVVRAAVVGLIALLVAGGVLLGGDKPADQPADPATVSKSESAPR